MNSRRDEQSDMFLNSDAVGDDFFNSIVENKLNITRDKFKLRLVLLSPATGKNENFVSVVYRAKIKYELLETSERKSIDVIIKALLSTLEEFKKFSVFPRERFMYEDVIASFERIWLERANETIQFGPQCIKFETDPYEIIVLDDLKANKYEMLNRKIGMTAEQAKIVLSKLAKFHAASAIRYQTDGIIQPCLDRKLSFPPEAMTEDNAFLKGFMRMYHEFVAALRSYGDCDVYADKIAAWDQTKLLSSWITVAEKMRSGFMVLAHGDAWLNNMMFKSNESGESEDVLLLDFQGPSWASPALDLEYFMISSVQDNVKIDQFDALIKHYHEELVESLKKLKYDQHIPTLDELHDDLLDKGQMAGSSIMFIMFVTKYDSPEEINLENMMTNENIEPEFYHRIYRNDNYVKALKLWLPFLNDRGYLDVMLPSKDDVQANGI